MIDKKKIDFSFEIIVTKLNQASNFILSEINWSTILEVNRQKHFKDLHDRVIVATAHLFDADLISKDRLLKGKYARTVW